MLLLKVFFDQWIFLYKIFKFFFPVSPIKKLWSPFMILNLLKGSWFEKGKKIEYILGVFPFKWVIYCFNGKTVLGKLKERFLSNYMLNIKPPTLAHPNPRDNSSLKKTPGIYKDPFTCINFDVQIKCQHFLKIIKTSQCDYLAPSYPMMILFIYNKLPVFKVHEICVCIHT